MKIRITAAILFTILLFFQGINQNLASTQIKQFSGLSHMLETVTDNAITALSTIAYVSRQDANSISTVKLLPITEKSSQSILKINFQDSATVTPVGWLRDYGQAYGPRTSVGQGSGLTYGWLLRSTKQPIDLTRNARTRTKPADTLLATLMQMQTNAAINYTIGPAVEGIWEIAIENGNYSVKVSVGDGIYVDSKHSINVENVPAITNFIPSAPDLFKDATVVVNVQDGRLTIDGGSGTHSKINYIIIEPTTQSPVLATVKTPLDDAFVRDQTYANTNYGYDTSLITKTDINTNGFTRLSYLKFDLGSIDTSKVSFAKLCLFGRNINNSSNLPISLYRVDDDSWTEEGITWANAPQSSTALSTMYVNNIKQYYEYDVTDFIKEQLAGNDTASFYIRVDSSFNVSTTAEFHSKEYGQNPPQLIIITGSTPETSTYTFSAEFLNQSGNISINQIAASKITGLRVANWDSAYNERITELGVSGAGDQKTITLTRVDGSTIAGTFFDTDIRNQYSDREAKRAWIDTVRATRLVGDTTRSPYLFGRNNAGSTSYVLDANGSTNISLSDVYPHQGLSSSHNNYNWAGPMFNVGSVATGSTDFRRGPLFNVSKNFTGKWGNTVWGNNKAYPEFLASYVNRFLLDSGSHEIYSKEDFPMTAGLYYTIIGSNSDLSKDTVTLQLGGWPERGPAAVIGRSDLIPVNFNQTFRIKGWLSNFHSFHEFGGNQYSSVDNLVHYAAGENVVYGSFPNNGLKNMFAFYVAPIKNAKIENAWGFYQAGINDKNFFAGDLYLNKIKPASGTYNVTIGSDGKLSIGDVSGVGGGSIVQPITQVVYGTGTGVTSNPKFTFNGTNTLTLNGSTIISTASAGASGYGMLFNSNNGYYESIELGFPATPAGQNRGLKFVNDATSAWVWVDGNNGSNNRFLKIGGSGGTDLITGDSNIRLRAVASTGNILIGSTTDDITYKLQVNGKIKAHGLRVQPTGWSDFVFEPSYKLRSLTSLEKYIHANKHLPGVPSAKEVAKNGIDVSEIQAKLLEKIEELTLYIIEQSKKLEVQARKLELLEQEYRNKK